MAYSSLGFGITCIDANYVEQGTACFYLMQEGDECAVLETGTSHSVPALEQLLLDQGIGVEQVRYVIPTHVHLDHAGGAGAMMAAFPAAQLLIHPRGAQHVPACGEIQAASLLKTLFHHRASDECDQLQQAECHHRVVETVPIHTPA